MIWGSLGLLLEKLFNPPDSTELGRAALNHLKESPEWAQAINELQIIRDGIVKDRIDDIKELQQQGKR